MLERKKTGGGGWGGGGRALTSLCASDEPEPAAPKPPSKAEREGAVAVGILKAVFRFENKGKMTEAQGPWGESNQQCGPRFRAAPFQNRLHGHVLYSDQAGGRQLRLVSRGS